MQVRNPAQRRYTRRFLTAMSLYVVALLVTKHAVVAAAPQGALLVALSILPALPLLASIWVMGLYLREEQDEYVRAQTVRGMTMATGLLLAICTSWGFLEEGRVLPHVPAWTAFPVWAVCLGVAQGWCALTARLGRAA